jgi:predicted phosphoribosyltransferase
MQHTNTIFKDRADAGLQLAEALMGNGIKADIVLALPRGGVPVGMMVAKKLGLPLKLYLVRKIGHPYNDEFAIGAVTENGMIMNETVHENPDYLDKAIKKERERIREMKAVFGNTAIENDIFNNRVILVDDGIATGTCVELAINELRKSGAKAIIVAVPVCALNTENKIRQIADKLITLKRPGHFAGIGAYYENFAQLTDNQVVELTKKSPIKAT